MNEEGDQLNRSRSTIEVDNLQLRHSRVKVFRLLLALQLIPIVILLVFLEVGKGADQDRQALLVIGAVGSSFIYLFFSAMAFSKLSAPEYLNISRSGEVNWTPFFFRHSYRLIEGEVFVDETSVKISARTAQGERLLPQTIPIPGTVIKPAKSMRMLFPPKGA